MNNLVKLELNTDPSEIFGRDYEIEATRNRGLLLMPVHSINTPMPLNSSHCNGSCSTAIH
jgi:hypothetical protein